MGDLGRFEAQVPGGTIVLAPHGDEKLFEHQDVA